MISRGQRDSVGGGGVVPEIFRGLPTRRKSVGGGVVADIFRGLPTRRKSVGGG